MPDLACLSIKLTKLQTLDWEKCLLNTNLNVKRFMMKQILTQISKIILRNSELIEITLNV